MLRYTPFIIMGLFALLQVLYFTGAFKRYNNRFVPLFLFLGLSAAVLGVSFLFP